MSRGQRSTPPVSDGGTTLLIESEPDEPASRAIVRGIVAIKGIEGTELDPLYDRIDPGALDTLISHARDHDSDVRVEFTFEGCSVVVQTDDRIRITDDP